MRGPARSDGAARQRRGCVSSRVATFGDVENLDGLDRLCFARPWGREAFGQEIARSYASILVVDGAFHGLAASICWWRVADEGEILRVATHPAHRRGGLARRLVAECLRRVQGAGCDRVHLEVAARNRAARGLYAAMGFREVGRRPGYYSTPLDDAVLLRWRGDGRRSEGSDL
ncbi:MAG: GNAT family N-acetyltransferase [Myxococcales bacterium FL481]|nr:MAG: GNAT family N-acetyltransferase [Myxococcales bacterium FL481]